MVYSAFGLSLGTSCAVPGLVFASPDSPPDARIWMNAPVRPDVQSLSADLWYVSDTEAGATPELRVWRLAGGRFFRMRYDDGTEFVVDRAGTEVWATWPASSTLEDAAVYLLGPVLGFVLRLRGVVCLHASAVAAGTRAILFVGPPEAGKSTAAAALSRMGHPVVTDDVAAIVEREGVLHVQPAYPQVRLWPDSVSFLYGSADALPRLTPTWDKRALDLTASSCRFQQQPLPVGAIYVLAERSNDSEPQIDGLGGRESVLSLLANSYTAYLPDLSTGASELTLLARLARTVPVRKLVPGGSPAQLTRMCERILEDCEAIGCTASPTMAR